MTPDEMRVRIATLLGWKRPEHPDAMKMKVGWTMPEKWWLDPSGKLRFKHDMKDYPASLDACAEFEATLTDKDRTAYQNTLAMLCGGLREDDGGQFVNHRDAISATALQRCEAFLRVKGEWR